MANSVTIGKIVDLLLHVPVEMLGTVFHMVERLIGNERKLWHENLKQFLKMELGLDDPGEVLSRIDPVGDEIRISAIEGVSTPVVIFEMARNGNFKTIFGSLGKNSKFLCLKEEQINAFVLEHREWLRKEGYATFFLFERDGEFFVKVVRVYSAGVRIHEEPFSHSRVWPAECKHRVVIPAVESF